MRDRYASADKSAMIKAFMDFIGMDVPRDEIKIAEINADGTIKGEKRHRVGSQRTKGGGN
jgi:hypothetical protein